MQKYNKNNIVTIVYSIFAISLPFNFVEYDLLGISRFEIKITMITFIMLFGTWLIYRQYNKYIYRKNEIIIYLCLFIYVLSQYLSSINSKYPTESLQQSFIITCLGLMLIITSQMVIGRETVHYVIISIAFTCLIVSAVSLFILYFFDNVARLGQVGIIPINISRGDPTVFGDIILFGIGPFYYAIFNFSRNYINWLMTIPFQIILLLAFVNTQSKGVLLSVLVFFLVSITLLKGKRLLLMFSFCIFLFVLIADIPVKRILLNDSHHVNTDNSNNNITDQKDIPQVNPVKLKNNIPDKKDRPQVNIVNLKNDLPNDVDENASFSNPLYSSSTKAIILQKKQTSLQENIFIDSYRRSRMSIMNNLGMSSINIRLKSIEVSFLNSLDRIWFGNGAGTSQKLLPKMATEYDKSIKWHTAKHTKMLKSGMLGVAAQWGVKPAISDGISENNVTLIDAHNLFLTELFNVGMIGSISLLFMICLILYEQIKLIKNNNYKDIIMNVLLFSTLLSMLAHRMTASLIVIPFLWFILGLNLGVTRFQYTSSLK